MPDDLRRKHFEVNVMRHSLLAVTSHRVDKFYYHEKWIFAMALIAKRKPDYKKHVDNQVKEKLSVLSKEWSDESKIKRLARYYVKSLQTLPKA